MRMLSDLSVPQAPYLCRMIRLSRGLDSNASLAREYRVSMAPVPLLRLFWSRPFMSVRIQAFHIKRTILQT